ncbi:hypothetical protein DW661_09180 [Collinsella sp. AM24-1]|uniref:hypothetical protein n=1 Tax=Collinsella sp. AM24-1 TaxID=2292031 RepID=UPI000E573A88|nr:hypothetical protein [Collinsella sp. AM24-1]RHF70232.1 hypothetical protein DW661_09180 [Collinsella sp. AM24-1]
MAFQDILAAIDIVTGPDPAHSILAFSIVVGLFLLWLRKQALARFYKAGIYVAALASDALFASVKLSLLWLAGVASPFLALSLFALLVNYFWCAQQLDDIVDKADPSLPECDYVAAFRLMNAVDRDRLSRMQLTCLDKDRIFCNIYLGNNGVAKRMLENENLEPAFRHFALHIIADAACDRAGSQAELESALAEKTDKTDPFITVQLWHNRAISYVVNGQFKVADDEFKKTYREAKRLGVRNKSFLLLLFENAALNKTKIGLPDGGVKEGWGLIEECEKALAPIGPNDFGQLFNLRLLFMRQIGTSIEDRNKLYLVEVKNTLSNASLSEQQRVVAMASLGRIAWSDGLDPAPVLNFFARCDRFLCVSDPDARYYAHKNLSAMLSGLAVNDRFPNTLAESVMRYFKDGDAEHDLDVMEDGLPPEAILRRSQVLRERAALALMVGESVERAVSYTDEAIGLLERSLQVMAALECRWQLARLTLYDKPEVAKLQLSIAEERLAALNKQPSLGYPYFEMSLCYALLGMRAECRVAYERAAGFETPMGHYAPGIRINRTAAFCARFYILTEMLGNPEEVCPLLKTREGRAWLSRYPKVSSLSKTLLCGKFLGYGDFVPAMTRLFLDEAGKLYAETWLVVQEIGLAFDLDSRKPGEEYGLVFEIQRHPLIADGDALARVAARRGHTVLDARLNQCNKDLLGADDATAVFDVLDALGILAEGRVPTLEDIMKSYLESCVDVPASG